MPAFRELADPFAAFDVVVVAASAGGIPALVSLFQNLPAELPAPIIAVLHLPPAAQYVSRLDEILQRHTALRVKWAEDGEVLLPGRIYLAPQDRSTVVNSANGRLLVRPSSTIKRFSPTADPLFASVAEIFGSRVLAVVLSGVLCDGAAGCAVIARAGGRVLAQIPSEAQFAGMPSAAMQSSQVGLAFDILSLAHVIINLVMVPGAAAWFPLGKGGACARFLPN